MGIAKMFGRKNRNFNTHTTLQLAYTILDINYVDFLQFQRDFIPQTELEEAFIYLIHKPIDFSIDLRLRILGHMVIGLKQLRVPIGT